MPLLFLRPLCEGIHFREAVQRPVLDLMDRPCGYVQFPGNFAPCAALKIIPAEDDFLPLVIQKVNVIYQPLLFPLQFDQAVNNFVLGFRSVRSW